jgi:response regulator of citrate/malate metabolism
VDKTLYKHLVDIDPHGFISILNERLAAYAKKRDTYDKSQTYSRSQIDSIINKAVNT